MQAVGGLQKELPSKPALRLSISIRYEAIKRGQDWMAIHQALKSWITNEAPRLSDGRSVIENAPGIPFNFHVIKATGRPPGIFVARYEPVDDTLPTRIRDLFDRKAKKLGKYHGSGNTTVLLVESADLALMNESLMLDAIERAFPKGPPAEVDQIWYADTSIPSDIEFRDFTPYLQKSHT